MRRIITALLLLVSFISLAQQDLRIGDWKAILPLNRGPFVTQSEEKIIYASDQSIVFIDKETRAISSFSKTDGLSDANIRFVKYHKPTKTLAVLYDNTNIDLIVDGRIRSFSQIRNNTNITGGKVFNDVSLTENGSLFLSCGFGLVELNLTTLEFGTTTFTPIEVLDFAEFGDFYYMATEEGIYRIDFTSGLNVLDFGLWEYLEEESGLPVGFPSQELAVHDGKIYAGIGGGLYVSEDGFAFDLIEERLSQEILYLSGETSDLAVGWRCSGCPNEVTFLSEDNTLVRTRSFCVSNPTYAIEDQNGILWLADRNNDFRLITGGPDGDCERINVNSIYSTNINDIDLRDDRIYIAAGGMLANSGYRFIEDGFFVFDGIEWNAFNKFNVDEFGQRDIRDMLKIGVHPESDTVFVGVYYDGLIKWVDEDNFIIYDETNSTLRRGIGDSNRIRVAGMDWDKDNNLWLGVFDAFESIQVYRKDGTWRGIAAPGTSNLMDVVVDNFDNKWYRVFRGGLLVFNEGIDIDDESDYRFRSITPSNSLLPTNNVTCMAVDLLGSVWIGTENGILIMNCGSDPFRPECRGSEQILEQDGAGAILLGGQTINAIAIDGGNRKWIGTASGLFVQSPQGDEPVYNFTASNSPLLDNNVRTIKIDDSNGLVYIGTDNGLQVFKAEATSGTGAFKPDVYAYPNPVRPDYDGPIAIKGMARDANFKVTDIEGRLLFEGRATGGQAIWDGRDLSGRRAKTGVYLVFATFTGNLEFPQSHVTKIVFIE